MNSSSLCRDLEPSINIHLYAADVRGPKGVQPDIVVGTPQKIKNSVIMMLKLQLLSLLLSILVDT